MIVVEQSPIEIVCGLQLVIPPFSLGCGDGLGDVECHSDDTTYPMRLPGAFLVVPLSIFGHSFWSWGIEGMHFRFAATVGP